MQAVRRIVRDAHRAELVVAHSRGLVKKSNAEKTDLDVSETGREVLILVQPELTRRGIALQAALADDLPPVHAVRVELQQVLLNLIVNAIEAMSGVLDRPRELTLAAQPHTRPDGGGVRVTVQDTGVGITPEQLERLFEAFFTTKPHGLGMGLSISRSIVEDHGGRLWATGNPGPGTTFEFTLPARPPRAL
jgi:signal transduction histidine kinase